MLLAIQLKAQGMIADAFVCADLALVNNLQEWLLNCKQEIPQLTDQMFSCLYNQELVELINEGSKGHYEQYYIDWIENDENYLYTWPETRKEKLLLGKKHRFITQLIAKVGINYDI